MINLTDLKHIDFTKYEVLLNVYLYTILKVLDFLNGPTKWIPPSRMAMMKSTKCPFIRNQLVIPIFQKLTH